MLAVFRTSVGIIQPLIEILNRVFVLETSLSAGNGIGNQTLLFLFVLYLLYINSFGLLFE